MQSRGLAISYLSPLLAVILGIVHAALAPVIVVAGVKPNLVLVVVVLVTILAGFQAGITWAFVAGLTANLLVGEPLGTVPLAMLIVAALSAGGARAFGRLTWIYPVLAALAGSIVADLVTLAIAQLVGEADIGGLPVDLILSAAALNAGLAALLIYPARAAANRWLTEEATAW
jgi:rod shape-determining protein MreD